MYQVVYGHDSQDGLVLGGWTFLRPVVAVQVSVIEDRVWGENETEEQLLVWDEEYGLVHPDTASDHKNESYLIIDCPWPYDRALDRAAVVSALRRLRAHARYKAREKLKVV